MPTQEDIEQKLYRTRRKKLKAKLALYDAGEEFERQNALKSLLLSFSVDLSEAQGKIFSVVDRLTGKGIGLHQPAILEYFPELEPSVASLGSIFDSACGWVNCLGDELDRAARIKAERERFYQKKADYLQTQIHLLEGMYKLRKQLKESFGDAISEPHTQPQPIA